MKAEGTIRSFHSYVASTDKPFAGVSHRSVRRQVVLLLDSLALLLLTGQEGRSDRLSQAVRLAASARLDSM